MSDHIQAPSDVAATGAVDAPPPTRERPGATGGTPSASRGIARRVSVDDPVAAEHRHDYSDAFELQLAADDPTPPEEWIRAGMSELPAWVKWVANARDGFGSAQIVESTADTVVLEDTDGLMKTVLVGRNLAPDRRLFTTVLIFRRPRLAAAFWSVVGILHRRVARRVIAGGT